MERLRRLIRGKSLNTAGVKNPLTEQQEALVDEFRTLISQQLNPENPHDRILSDLFNVFRTAFSEIIPEMLSFHNRAKKKDLVPGQQEISTPVLGTLLGDFSAIIDWILDLQGNSDIPTIRKWTSTCSTAAKLLRFHSVETLNAALNDQALLNMGRSERILPQEGQEPTQEQMTDRDFLDIFSPRLRLHFAVGNISDPLAACRRVVEHLTTTLHDDALIDLGRNEQVLPQEGAEFSQGQMTDRDFLDIFSPRLRLHFAINNISDPLEGFRR